MNNLPEVKEEDYKISEMSLKLKLKKSLKWKDIREKYIDFKKKFSTKKYN